jgi:cytochrome bd ubiquinol oxidase subunit I
VLAVSAWHLARSGVTPQFVEVFRRSMRIGLVTVLLAGVAVTLSGHIQAQIMTKQQPMKMAAAEALCSTEADAGFSLFSIGSIDASCDEVKSVHVPGLLSLLATNSTNGTVEGVNDLQKADVAKYGPGNYIPSLPVTYWTFRLMMGLGILTILVALLGVWVYRRGRAPRGWFARIAVVASIAPFLANSFGWIFTEMGRQPWVVVPNPTGNTAVHLLTQDGVSPTVGSATVLISLVAFTLLYGVLGIVELVLFLRYAKAGPLPEHDDDGGTGDGSNDEQRPMAFAY